MCRTFPVLIFITAVISLWGLPAVSSLPTPKTFIVKRYIYYVEGSSVRNDTSSVVSHVRVLRTQITRPPVPGIKISHIQQLTNGQTKLVQVIKLTTPLVDFDISWTRYGNISTVFMALCTRRSRDNLELYAWQNSQFDMIAIRHTHAIPASLKLFKINEHHHIAVAQQQLYTEKPDGTRLPLTDSNAVDEDDGTVVRFIGSPIFRFNQHDATNLVYLQYLKLNSDPIAVEHIVYRSSVDLNTNSTSSQYFLRFIAQKSAPQQSENYLWSPIDGLFWPYYHRLPQRSAKELRTTDPVETCFIQLEGILRHRESQASLLFSRSRDMILNTGQSSNHSRPSVPAIDITTPIIVHGNVRILGSLLGTPQLVAVRNSMTPSPPPLYNYEWPPSAGGWFPLSPSYFEQSLALATNTIRDMERRLKSAVLNVAAHSQDPIVVRSPIRFLTDVVANSVNFRGGIENDNVILNGIPFRHLRDRAVTLTGRQKITAHTEFRSTVMADRLEVRALINGRYYLADAVDIESTIAQEIQTTPAFLGGPSIEFVGRVRTPRVIMTPNARINHLYLNDLVTVDMTDVEFTGCKQFRNLTMGTLELTPYEILNDYNVARLVAAAIQLHVPKDHVNILRGLVRFEGPVFAKELKINNMINGHINLTTLLTESVRANGADQNIYGHKRFTAGLRIDHLTSKSRINDVEVQRMFTLSNQMNLNPTLESTYRPKIPEVTGQFAFNQPVTFVSDLNTHYVNGINLNSEAVLRNQGYGLRSTPPVTQIIMGHKTFLKPLRVVNSLDTPYLNATINDINLRSLAMRLDKLTQQPPPVYVDKLEITGNLNIATGFINNNTCSLNKLRDTLLLRTGDQTIKSPIKISTLRAQTLFVEKSGLNGGLSFPDDFVLRSGPPQTVYGSKQFARLALARGPVTFGSEATINSIAQSQIRSYMAHEQQHVGRVKSIKVLKVHGNIIANRINGRRWPDEVLLRNAPHQRIHTPIVFRQNLNVRGHLDLKGPLILRGRFNGVNLTEFVRNSVTLGDKDLIEHRPIRNKKFAGGLSAHYVDSLGTIDGIDFDEMRSRVVTLDGEEQQIFGQKVFMSNVTFKGPLKVNLINELNFDEHIKRVVLADPLVPSRSMLTQNHSSEYASTASHSIMISGRKTIAGTLTINKDLLIDGKINGLNLSDIYAKSISLSRQINNTFNRTMIIEGDVYIDNLSVDGRRMIDGVHLNDLIPIDVNRSQQFDVPVKLTNTVYVTGNVNVNGLPVDCRPTSLIRNKLQPPTAPPAGIDVNPSMTDRRPLSYQSEYTISNHGQKSRHKRSVVNGNINSARFENINPILAPPPPHMFYPAPEQQHKVPAQRRWVFVNDIYIDNLIVHGLVNGVNVTDMINDAVLRNSSYPQRIVSHKHLTQGAMVNNGKLRVFAPITLDGLINGVDVHELDRSMVHNNRATQIRGVKSFRGPVVFKGDVTVRGKVSGLRVPDDIVHGYSDFVSNSSSLTQKPVAQRLNALMLSRPRRIVAFDPRIRNSVPITYARIDDHPQHLNTTTPRLSSAWVNDLLPREPGMQISVLSTTSYVFSPYVTRYTFIVTAATQTSPMPLGARSMHVPVTLPTVPTTVYSMEKRGTLRKMSILPTHNPTQAMFIEVDQSLFLLIAQDQSPLPMTEGYCPAPPRTNMIQTSGNIQVYLFHALQNSSNLSLAYFDLYQTIDLPSISHMQSFKFAGADYVLASSRGAGIVYLLQLKGYSGFQVIHQLSVPYVESTSFLWPSRPDWPPGVAIHSSDQRFSGIVSFIVE